MSERRIYQRRTLTELERCPLEYKIQGGGFFQKNQIALTKNISASGLLFISPSIYALSTVLIVKLTLPENKKPISLKGKVVRAESTQNSKINLIAITYVEIDPKDQLLIDQFCQGLKSEKSELQKEKDHKIYI